MITQLIHYFGFFSAFLQTLPVLILVTCCVHFRSCPKKDVRLTNCFLWRSITSRRKNLSHPDKQRFDMPPDWQRQQRLPWKFNDSCVGCSWEKVRIREPNNRNDFGTALREAGWMDFLKKLRQNRLSNRLIPKYIILEVTEVRSEHRHVVQCAFYNQNFSETGIMKFAILQCERSLQNLIMSN